MPAASSTKVVAPSTTTSPSTATPRALVSSASDMVSRLAAAPTVVPKVSLTATLTLTLAAASVSAMSHSGARHSRNSRSDASKAVELKPSMSPATVSSIV